MKRFLLLLAAFALLSLLGCGAAPVETTAPTAPAATTAPTEIAPEQTEPIPIPGIIITEVMPDNEALWLGCEADWVELYNPEQMAVDLEGWYLTDDPTLGSFMALSGLLIPEEDYLAIPLDGSFGLSSSGETVYLAYGMEIVSQLTFGAAVNGESFDAEGPCQWTTPGYANTEDGYYAYLENQELPELIISEVLPSNSNYLAHKTNYYTYEYYDLVEVKNQSQKPISLGAYSLSDKRNTPDRYRFPDVTLAPGEYYVVYCSGDVSLGENHASFKVSAEGETLYLSKEGVLADVLAVPGDLKENESFGRSGSLPAYLEKPTFGAENAAGFRSGVAVPEANLPTGLYDQAVEITLSGEGTIYYTTDGSRPTTRSRVYTDPITIRDIATIRAFCVSGNRRSEIVNYTYLIGKEHDLPIVTVAIPERDLTGTEGVLNNITMNYEREAVLTLIEDGQEKFSIPFGFRLHGNDSRKGNKQNFSLRFRSEYGAAKLEYKLFDDRDIDTFNSLLLKGGSEDWYKSIMRDELATQVANGTTHLYTQAIKPVVLYLGDEYWGIYYLRERYSADYVASHLGVSPESVNLLYSTGASRQSGEGRDFYALKSYVQSHDMRKEENYDYLAEQVDILSLMDWYICRSYMGDKDTANIRRFMSEEHDGKWRWMYFDLDWAFIHTADKPTSGLVNGRNGEPILIRAALASEKGQDVFLKRYAELMGTILNEEYFNQVIDALVAAIETEVPRDRARWGIAVSRWEKSVQALRDYVNDGKRDKNVLADLKTYFGLSQAEMEYYFGEVMP